MSKWFDAGPTEAVAADSSSLTAELETARVVVVRCGAELHAVEDRCTHDGEELGEAEIEDCQIVCPRHGARFCLRTGDALTPPAYEALRTFRVREEAGRVLVEDDLA